MVELPDQTKSEKIQPNTKHKEIQKSNTKKELEESTYLARDGGAPRLDHSLNTQRIHRIRKLREKKIHKLNLCFCVCICVSVFVSVLVYFNEQTKPDDATLR